MIIKTNSIKDLDGVIDETSLLALDLDKTLFTCTTYHGSVDWEENLIIKFQEEGFSKKEAIDRADILWKNAQNDITIELLEKESSALINKWKESCSVIGLTARSIDLKKLTSNILSSNDIFFSSFKNNKQNFDFFYEGILFCSNHYLKSKILLEFINLYCCYKDIKKIILLDDKLENLNECLNSSLSNRFQLLCYHYS